MFDFCGCPDGASTTHVCPLLVTACSICGQTCVDVTHICRIGNVIGKVYTIPN